MCSHDYSGRIKLLWIVVTDSNRNTSNQLSSNRCETGWQVDCTLMKGDIDGALVGMFQKHTCELCCDVTLCLLQCFFLCVCLFLVSWCLCWTVTLTQSTHLWKIKLCGAWRSCMRYCFLVHDFGCYLFNFCHIFVYVLDYFDLSKVGQGEWECCFDCAHLKKYSIRCIDIDWLPPTIPQESRTAGPRLSRFSTWVKLHHDFGNNSKAFPI